MAAGSPMLWLVDGSQRSAQLTPMITTCKIPQFFVCLFTILVHLPLEIDGMDLLPLAPGSTKQGSDSLSLCNGHLYFL